MLLNRHHGWVWHNQYSSTNRADKGGGADGQSVAVLVFHIATTAREHALDHRRRQLASGRSAGSAPANQGHTLSVTNTDRPAALDRRVFARDAAETIRRVDAQIIQFWMKR